MYIVFTILFTVLNRKKSTLDLETGKLKQAFTVFKSKAPVLESRISDIEKLPGIFQNLYETVSKQKDTLRGLTEDEARIQITKHKQDVENLKKQREETESKIRNSMAAISSEHRRLTEERINLEQRLDSYKAQQDRLLQESNNVSNSKKQLEQIIREYKKPAGLFN